MNNFAGMEILQTDNDTRNKKDRILLTEDAVIAKMIAKVPSITIVHNKIEILSILEAIGHVD